jgi:hypothetical protein
MDELRRRSADRENEWVAVLPAAYAAARGRHALARADAYAIAREDALERGVCGPDLRITDIDEHALATWQRTWRETHPSRAGGWRWPLLLERLPHRAAVLPIAIWYGDDLCGLALGHASRRRLNHSRHTITVTFVERRPEPPPVVLRGRVIAVVTAIAREYGLIVGARRLRLRAPDRNLLSYYEQHGFRIAWKGNMPVHCEKEIGP